MFACNAARKDELSTAWSSYYEKRRQRKAFVRAVVMHASNTVLKIVSSVLMRFKRMHTCAIQTSL